MQIESRQRQRTPAQRTSSVKQLHQERSVLRVFYSIPVCPSTSCFFKLPSRLVPLLSTTSFSSISSQLLCSSLSLVLFNSWLVLLLAQSLFVFPTGIHVLRTDVTHAQSAMRVWWRSTSPLRGGQCRAFALKECQAEKHTPFKNNGVQPKWHFRQGSRIGSYGVLEASDTHVPPPSSLLNTCAELVRRPPAKHSESALYTPKFCRKPR